MVTRLWRHNFELIGRSLRHGYYQGWDLHPAQLPVRYAAVFAFFLEQAEAQAARLRAFAARQARASVEAGVFDDAATVRGVINFFRRGIACGALTAADLAVAGIGPEDLREGPDA